MFSLESPHRIDSNEYIQYIIFNINESTHTGANARLQLLLEMLGACLIKSNSTT